MNECEREPAMSADIKVIAKYFPPAISPYQALSDSNLIGHNVKGRK